MQKRVFLTGVSGYLGGVLASSLAGLPDVECVTGLVHHSSPRLPLSPKIKLINMDIRSAELADVMAGHDIVIHLAQVVYWLAKMPAEMRDDINYNGTRNVAQAALKNGVHHFIQASSIGAYDPTRLSGQEKIQEDYPIGSGDSSLYYWNSKSVTEKILFDAFHGTSTNLTLLRMGYVVGPCNTTTVANFRKNAICFFGKNPRVHFVHEDDVAKAFVHVLRERLFGAYNVVADDSIRLNDIYPKISAKSQSVPHWLVRLVAFVKWKYMGSDLHPSWIEATLLDYSVSNEKLKSTGWFPRHSSVQALCAASSSPHS